jgi:hypothetical protein
MYSNILRSLREAMQEYGLQQINTEQDKVSVACCLISLRRAVRDVSTYSRQHPVVVLTIAISIWIRDNRDTYESLNKVEQVQTGLNGRKICGYTLSWQSTELANTTASRFLEYELIFTLPLL